ncbi:MAG: hypothetical protein XD75_0082 [Parcubacteria bacterium 33_209]|nr:MAG: hypothetical protein XD75_0082 [Parcubacteria bacterium 33_209]
MSRKIYDIIPNERAEQKETFCHKEKPKKNKNPFIFISFFVVVALLGVFFFLPGKAEVSMYPNIEEVSVTSLVTIDVSEALADFDNLVLPGIIFSNTKEATDSYLSTGTDSKTKRATGVIRVYNKISPAKNQSLVKNTRFLSVPGELTYRADEAFTIPANGYVDIAVTADEAGTEYNINSATFSIPGLVGTNIYSSIYAETISPLEGGEDSQVKIVTVGDISSSKESFEKKYSEIAKEELINSIPESFIYIPENISLEVEDIYADAPAGAEVESFNVYGKINSKVTAFRKDDLIKVGEKLINNEIFDNIKIVPGSILCDIEEYKVVGEKIELSIVFNAKTYSLPEEELLRNGLLNNSKINSASLLENMAEISKVEIDIFPFWRSTLPSKKESVEIKLKFD